MLPAVAWERNRIWIWDATHFTRAQRVAYAIVDVVTRYWIGYLLTSETSSTQVQLLFATALEAQGLLDPATGVLLDPDGRPLERGDDSGPILVAWSDNGPEMTSADTRQFMALMTIAQHHGRPGTPTDQAHVESFFSHLKGDWPHLADIRDPAALDTELARVRTDYNTMRLHADMLSHPRRRTPWARTRHPTRPCHRTATSTTGTTRTQPRTPPPEPPTTWVVFRRRLYQESDTPHPR